MSRERSLLEPGHAVDLTEPHRRRSGVSVVEHVSATSRPASLSAKKAEQQRGGGREAGRPPEPGLGERLRLPGERWKSRISSAHETQPAICSSISRACGIERPIDIGVDLVLGT